jgi:hypothetical protein
VGRCERGGTKGAEPGKRPSAQNEHGQGLTRISRINEKICKIQNAAHESGSGTGNGASPEAFPESFETSASKAILTVGHDLKSKPG